MCREGNTAPLSIQYINAQLSALWQTAYDCASNSTFSPHDVSSPEYEKTKYIRALAQFQSFGKETSTAISSTDDFLFYALFDKPQIKFICDHDAILSLNIREGHANLNYNISFLSETKVNHTKNKTVGHTRVDFRIGFSRSAHPVREADVSDGTAKHIIQTLILNMDSAKLITFKSQKLLPVETKHALAFYLHKYLQFLAHAGHHVLFDLPNFADGSRQPKSNFTTYRDNSVDPFLLSDSITDNIKIAEVNDALYFRWRDAARRSIRPVDFLSLCLAELSSAWLANSVVARHFYIQFGIPEIHALCSREVILTFDIRNVAFFKIGDFGNENPDAVFHDWKISFITRVVRDETTRCITLELDTAQYANRFSSFAKTDAFAESSFNEIVQFMQVNYLALLIQYSMHIVQLFEERVSITGTTFHGPRIDELNLCGFDYVLTMSQSCINSRFLNLHKHASTASSGADTSIARWSLDQFSVHFNPLSVNLLSNGKTIVFINISFGEMSLPRQSEKSIFWQWCEFGNSPHTEQADKIEFGETTLAFEVPLELGDNKNSLISRFSNALHGAHGKSLLLNLRESKFMSSLSNIASLGKDRNTPVKLDTLLYYVQIYFRTLTQHNHNVIHTMPAPTFSEERTIRYAHTPFKLVSNSENCRQVSVANDPILLILGLSDCNPGSLSSHTTKWLSEKILDTGRSNFFGALCLSSKTILEDYLLPTLSAINASTTILSKAAIAPGGKLNPDLSTWRDDISHCHEPCTWKEIERNDKHLAYIWEHLDEWSCKREGTTGGKNSQYALTCSTKNSLDIPVASRYNGLEMHLGGESSLKISGKYGTVSWSKKTVAKWSTSILIYFRANGLTVEVSNQVCPIMTEEVSEGHCPSDIIGLHQKHLPRTVNFEQVTDSLKRRFEAELNFTPPGGDKYGFLSPTFTREGDLVMQLCEYKGFSFVQAPRTPPIIQHSVLDLDKDVDSSTSTIESPPLGSPEVPTFRAPASIFTSKILETTIKETGILRIADEF